MTADLDILFADFGVMALVDALEVVVLFDAPFERIDPGGLGIEASGPQIVVKSAAVPGVAHGSTVVVGAESYRVIAAQPDGAGLTVLILSED